MPTYEVTKQFTYEITVTVDADDAEQAEEIASHIALQRLEKSIATRTPEEQTMATFRVNPNNDEPTNT